MTTLSALLLGLSGVADTSSGTATVPFPIDRTAPGPDLPADQVILHDAYYPLPWWGEDRVVASTWPYVTCVLQTGHVHAEFSATRATWPTTWPDTATCTVDSFGVELATVAIELVPCDNPRCRRRDRDESFVPRCSFPWNVETPGLMTDGCLLPPPPPGQVYAPPGPSEWNARRRIGLLANPDTDPAVEAVTCRIGASSHPPEGPWFGISASHGPEVDLRVYCPIPYQSVSTGERWWGPEAILGVHRL
jgi:hypothetical protein